MTWTRQERAALVARLQRARSDSQHPNHAALAQALLGFLQSGEVQIVPMRWGRWQRWRRWANRQADRWLTRSGLKLAMAAGLLLLGLGALIELVLLLPNTPTSQQMARLFLANGQDASANRVFLYVTRVILEGAVGLALLAGSLLLLVGWEAKGIAVAYLGLLVSLTVVDLLVFYFDQFSAILVASFQFHILVALLYYRNRYLSLAHPAASPARDVATHSRRMGRFDKR